MGENDQKVYICCTDSGRAVIQAGRKREREESNYD